MENENGVLNNLMTYLPTVPFFLGLSSFLFLKTLKTGLSRFSFFSEKKNKQKKPKNQPFMFGECHTIRTKSP